MKSDLKVPKATCETLSTLLMLILGIAEGMTRQKSHLAITKCRLLLRLDLLFFCVCIQCYANLSNCRKKKPLRRQYPMPILAWLCWYRLRQRLKLNR
ncbi:hypothetical protein ACED29_07450 [Shewanella sp. 5S214]|uniref:hypothetical protein n=1 Tax=Shewanella sp. 5S214 TaxID=3229999 RepID=UPI00352BE23B